MHTPTSDPLLPVILIYVFDPNCSVSDPGPPWIEAVLSREPVCIVGETPNAAAVSDVISMEKRAIFLRRWFSILHVYAGQLQRYTAVFRKRGIEGVGTCTCMYLFDAIFHLACLWE